MDRMNQQIIVIIIIITRIQIIITSVIIVMIHLLYNNKHLFLIGIIQAALQEAIKKIPIFFFYFTI
ncbi:hypothetical protein BDC45DRAFT_507822, partial [Circinella umbellata]